MVRVAQHFVGDALDEGVLHLARGAAGGEAGAVGDAENVGIDSHRRLVEGDVEDDIGGLAADSRQRLEGGAVLRHLAPVALDQQPGEGRDVAGLALPEAEAADMPRDAGLTEGGHGGRGRGFGEEGLGGLVDGFVGGLRGEGDGDEEGEGILEVELAPRIGVGGGEGHDEGAGGRGADGLCGRGGPRAEHEGFVAGGAVRDKIGGMTDTWAGNRNPLSFEAVIVPHRSLSRRGLYVVIGFISALSALISFLCWRLGAWPVVGFNGAEIGFALLALNWHAASARRASEVLLLGEDGLRVVRAGAGGRREETVLPVGWLRVVLEERRGRVPALLVLAQGARLEVGAALGEEEKRSLAAALADAIERLRHPVFDNPQLRD